MSRAWHGGKGDDTRRESERGSFERGYDGIDWSATRKPAETVAPEAPVKRQYYYRTNGCNAADAGSAHCTCWHSEGEGPFPHATPSAIETDVGLSFGLTVSLAWRDAPTSDGVARGVA